MMIIKRSVLSLIAAAMCAIGCYAQEEGGSSTLWGLRIAGDLNIPSKWHFDGGSVKMYNHGYGVTVGGVCNLYLGNNFYLEPGVSLYYDAYSMDIIVADSDMPSGIGQKDPGINKFGVRVPVVAGYTIGNDIFSMCVYTGPEFCYSFGGKLDIADDDLNVLFDLQHRADVAWKVGLGFPYKSIMIGVDAAFGITDIQKGDLRAHDRRLSLSLTYYL